MKKALPTGTSNYQQLKTDGYYVIDKTLMIQEYLERKTKVTLITRPRRFGKTSAMSMMAEFFDITKDSKEIFKGTKIMDTEYASQMNQYPTIFISFAAAKGDLINTIKFIKQEIKDIYKKYGFIFENISPFDVPYYKIICDSFMSPDDGKLSGINNALLFLTEKLEEYYKKKVMVFIDEYDIPFVEAHVNKFYKEIHAGLASLLQSSLKDNDSLQYAMLTGIQRVAKENIFSNLNNPKVFTVNNKEYAEYFGFTKQETIELFNYYDLEYTQDVKEMYDGYRIGGLDIYNPWSIINYADEKILKPYWVNTSGNQMVKDAMRKSDITFKKDYNKLIQQGYLDTEINIETSFYEESETRSLWGLFVNAGYLTIEETLSLENQEYRIRIPNKEVVSEFKSITAYFLHVDTSELMELYKSIRTKDKYMFQNSYEKILAENPSYHDLISENSYHMLILGICLYIKNDYEIISNREAGNGRCDIVLKAKKDNLPSYVIELKYMKKEEYEKHPENLETLAQEAINQIDRSKYDSELTGDVIHIGLAHAGKNVEIAWKECE